MKPTFMSNINHLPDAFTQGDLVMRAYIFRMVGPSVNQTLDNHDIASAMLYQTELHSTIGAKEIESPSGFAST